MTNVIILFLNLLHLDLMEFSNDITLRPRFSLELNALPENVLYAFEEVANTQEDFIISCVDDHVFIRIPKHKQHFWSPQLHLEIYKIEQQPTVLKGLFGPKPTVWTLFMFCTLLWRHYLLAQVYGCIVLLL